MVVRSHECMQEGVGWPFEGTAMGRNYVLYSRRPIMRNSMAFMVLYNHAVPGAEPVQGS